MKYVRLGLALFFALSFVVACSGDGGDDGGGDDDTGVADIGGDTTADDTGLADSGEPADTAQSDTGGGDTVAADTGAETSGDDATTDDTAGGDTMDDTGYSITDQPLQGEINGQAWEYSFGEAAEASFEEDRFEFQIFAGSGSECDGFDDPTSDDDRYVNGRMPKTEGTYPLGTDETITITWDENDDGVLDNAIADEGVLVIEEVTADEITGRMHARSDDDNWVEGNFVMGHCDLL